MRGAGRAENQSKDDQNCRYDWNVTLFPSSDHLQTDTDQRNIINNMVVLLTLSSIVVRWSPSRL